VRVGLDEGGCLAQGGPLEELPRLAQRLGLELEHVLLGALVRLLARVWGVVRGWGVVRCVAR